jgi:hypothetical protein
LVVIYTVQHWIIVRTIPFDQLSISDLYVDALYEGGRRGNAGDDPLPKLLRVDSQGGFRKRGKVAGKLNMLVLTSSMNDPDWPDSLDRETRGGGPSLGRPACASTRRTTLWCTCN